MESQVRDLSGAKNFANPTQDSMRRWGNMVLHKIARLLTGIDKPWGRTTSTLTLLQDAGQIYLPAGAASYTAATNTFSGLTGMDQTYVGGWAFWEDNGNSRAFYGLIDTVAAAGTSCVLRVLGGTGAEVNVSAANLYVIFKPNPAFYNGANLGSLSVLDSVKIVDGTNGNLVRLESDAFAGFLSNPNYNSSVVTEFAGEAAYIDKGSSLSSLGTMTMTYDEKPDNIASATTEIDLLPEHLQMFTEELVRWTLNYLQKPIPKEYENPLKTLEEQYKKSAESIMNRMKGYVPAQRAERRAV